MRESWKMVDRRDLGLDQGGFVKVHYELYKSWLAEKPLWLSAWVTLVAMAEWEPRKRYINGELIVVQRGELSHAQRYLASSFKMTRDQLRYFLRALERDGAIQRRRIGTGQDIITICNYEKYQGSSPRDDTAFTPGVPQQPPGSPPIYKDKIKEDTKNTHTTRENNQVPVFGYKLDNFEMVDGRLTMSDSARKTWLPHFGDSETELERALLAFTPKTNYIHGDSLERHARFHLNTQASKRNRPKSEDNRPHSIAHLFK